MCLELHDGCASNQQRSHFQLVMPSPKHVLSEADELVVVKRIQCHYNPVWVDGQPKWRVGDLPRAFRDHYGLP